MFPLKRQFHTTAYPLIHVDKKDHLHCDHLVFSVTCRLKVENLATSLECYKVPLSKQFSRVWRIVVPSSSQSRTAWLWRWEHHYPRNRRELLTQHSILPQNTRLSSNTAFGTSSVTIPFSVLNVILCICNHFLFFTSNVSFTDRSNLLETNINNVLMLLLLTGQHLHAQNRKTVWTWRRNRNLQITIIMR